MTIRREADLPLKCKKGGTPEENIVSPQVLSREKKNIPEL